MIVPPDVSGRAFRLRRLQPKSRAPEVEVKSRSGLDVRLHYNGFLANGRTLPHSPAISYRRVLPARISAPPLDRNIAKCPHRAHNEGGFPSANPHFGSMPRSWNFWVKAA
jgi:hypothetical protein